MTIDDDGCFWTFFPPLSKRNLFWLRAGRTENDIISREIKAPKCPRAKHSCKFMFFIKKWYFLKPTRMNLSSLEHRVFHKTDTCIDICMREEFEKVWYDEFCSSEVDKPVNDNSDAFIFRIHFPNSIVFSSFFNILFPWKNRNSKLPFSMMHFSIVAAVNDLSLLWQNQSMQTWFLDSFQEEVLILGNSDLQERWSVSESLFLQSESGMKCWSIDFFIRHLFWMSMISLFFLEIV